MGVEWDGEQQARAELSRLQLQIKDILRDPTFDAVRKEADLVLERAGSVRARASKGRRRLAGPVTTIDGQVKVPWPK